MLTKVEIIIQYIEGLIESESLSKKDQIPSLTKIMKEHHVSRDTVIRAYKDLNNRGIIKAVHGKGYFVSNQNVMLKKNLFLLLDELSSYKNTLVKSIERNLNSNDGQYRIFFHHYDAEVFQRLIEQHVGQFTHYVISPFPNAAQIKKSIEQLPEHRVILLDRHDDQSSKWQFVGQEFHTDILNCLYQLLDRTQKYKRFFFVFPDPSHHPQELKTGFKEYCQKQGIECQIISHTSSITIEPNGAYLVIDDSDLAFIVKNSHANGWRLGKDIGLISYNETPLKSVIANGITTISTDFDQMGQRLVDMIFDPKISYVHNKASLILRNSF